MLIEKKKKSYLNFKNINFILHNPSIFKAIIEGKSKEEIRVIARRLKEIQAQKLAERQAL